MFGMLIPDHINWLYDHLPYFWNWVRYTSFFKSLNFLTLQEFDEKRRAQGGAISKRNDGVRKALTEFIRETLKERPDLVANMLPPQAPSVRRMVIDNGFYEAIQRDNVELNTEKIERITEMRILTKDGHEREFVLIVLELVSRWLNTSGPSTTWVQKA